MITHEQVLPKNFTFIPDFKLAPVGGSRRSSALFGEDFCYDGIYRKATDWSESPMMSHLKKSVEEHYGVTFKTCLVGFYPDGEPVLKLHHDRMSDEDTDNGLIVNMSFGEPRVFVLQNIWTLNSQYYMLQNGQACTFTEVDNKDWQHTILPLQGLAGPRYSLTFRTASPKD